MAPPLHPETLVQNGGRPIVIRLLLAAHDPHGGETTVETSFELNAGDPRWPAWLLDAATFKAQEGARRLRDALMPHHALADDAFVPLAAVAPAAGARR